MGPSLARAGFSRPSAESGSRTRVWAASRFASGAVRASLESAGVETVACDLMDREQVAALPDCPYVPFLAGRKFGTSDRTDLDVDHQHRRAGLRRTALLSVADGRVSTGNVYPLVPSDGPAAAEDLLPSPVGEYAQSCLGRERVVEFVSRETGMPAVIFRLNYAVDLRYGTLVDIARRVLRRRSNRSDRRVLQCDLAG